MSDFRTNAGTRPPASLNEVLTELGLILQPQGVAPITGTDCGLHVAADNELYYRDGTSTFKLTSGGALNGGIGGPLTDGQLIVGSAANIATAVTMSGEATIDNVGAVTLTNSAVIGKLLTGLSATSGQVAATDSILAAFGKLAGVSFPATGTLLANALTSAQIFVGSGANVATGVVMSGEATIDNVGAVTLANSAVIGKVLTGYSAGAGTVAATDTILEALQKLDGNILAIPDGSGRRQIYDITAGAVPPSSGAVGTTLGFFQSLDFDPDADNDIYFQFALPDNVDITDPVTIVVKYCMGSDNAGDVKLNLDYIASDLTDDLDPAAATDTLTDTFTPGAGAEVLRSHSGFEIDAADLSSTDMMVSCHLTRDATDGADTHTGTFRILAIEIHYTPTDSGGGGGGGATEVTAWTAWTPTGSWIVNSTYSGFWRLVGDTLECQVRILLAGAPTNTSLLIDLPPAYVANTAKMFARGLIEPVGIATLYDAGTRIGLAVVQYNTSTYVRVVYQVEGANAWVGLGPLSATAPFTWANGDEIYATFSLPVTAAP